MIWQETSGKQCWSVMFKEAVELGVRSNKLGNLKHKIASK